VTAAESLPEDHLLDEVTEFCSRLIQFDTSNFGGGESRGEREAAEWVAEQLAEVGYEPLVLESAPRRANTVVRIPGADPDAPALLVHGHLDVVPAMVDDWSVGPFSGEIRDGSIWGRGALDMKDMVAMMLAVARDVARHGVTLPRDVVLAFVADEEDKGDLGAQFLVREHADLLEGVTTAIGESGGFAVHLPNGGRVYPIATGERGSAWMTVTAKGTAGHGSRANPDNAVSNLVRVLAALSDLHWPVTVIPSVAALLSGLSEHLGIEVDPTDPESLAQLGDAARLVTGTLSNTVNPTMLSAGYKHNVIPTVAVGGVDGRILPGAETSFFESVDAILGDRVTREFASFAAPVSASHDSTEFAAMAAAIRVHDPDALVLPYCMAGGTDAKAFNRLGIDCYGFAPGRNPPGVSDYDLVHGVDEHVRIDSLEFGVRVLASYLNASPTPRDGPGTS